MRTQGCTLCETMTKRKKKKIENQVVVFATSVQNVKIYVDSDANDLSIANRHLIDNKQYVYNRFEP